MEQAAFIKKYATTRRHTDSLKWDALQARYGNPDLLAMWVADMEFKVPEQVTQALQERVAHGCVRLFDYPRAVLSCFY